MKQKTVQGCIVGLSGFIGQHHLSSARSIISPRVNIDACVPGSEQNYEANRKIALDMGFPDERIYPNLEQMVFGEKGRSQFVLIATPNHLHAEQCIAAADAGFHVICDKPLARTAKEADTIVNALKDAGRQSCVTATYCGHRAIIEARRVVSSWGSTNLKGGTFRYYQAWLKKKVAEMKPEEGLKQATWRKDPQLSGEGGAAGDILSHLLFQLYFMTGLQVVSVRANRRFVVEGKGSKLTDDYAFAYVTLENGAEITLEACQYAGGHQNDNSFELWFGGGRSLGWDVRQSEFLWITADGPRQLLTKDDFQSKILELTHSMPSLHVDGWHDANARLINSFARAILAPVTGNWHLTALDARNINAVLDAIIESADQGPMKLVSVNWRSLNQ